MVNSLNKILSISIVLYKTNYEQLYRCINSINIFDATIIIYIIDNSPDDNLKRILVNFNNVKYFFNPDNPGYGAAHNIAIRDVLKNNNPYHLILNADVYFDEYVLPALIGYMDDNLDVGMVMPKVLFPDGRLQFLCKLLPSPFDLLGRLILPHKILKKFNYRFEMRCSEYNKEMYVPYLSGCFMFIRVDALKKYGIFDERFFMYPEDIDLTRRITVGYRTMFYPYVSIFHDYGGASKKSIRMLLIHGYNIIKYFNKWGWFFDSERKRINGRALFYLKKISNPISKV